MSSTTLSDAWIGDVLDFWFRELGPEDWYKKDDAIDATIRKRFGALYEALARTKSVDVPTSARVALATVIVLDQFPRNMFRSSPKSFASDAHALTIAQSAIARGLDRELPAGERQFLYMPFQHSEDRGVQARSVELFANLGDVEVLRFAELHKAIIDRFRRFPHRNAVLGRAATPEEIAFLSEPDSSF